MSEKEHTAIYTGIAIKTLSAPNRYELVSNVRIV